MPVGEVRDGPVTKINIGRLTNAIFAFTFLLLFKNIRTPSFEDYIGNSTAHQFGLMQVPDILNFFVVFVVLAMIWVVTFYVFHQVERMDWTSLYLHFVLLMWVIFIPISSNLSTVFSANAGVSLFFHLNMLAIGIVLFLEWRHYRKFSHLLKPGIPRDELRISDFRMLFLPFTAIVGCVLANYDIPYTPYMYFGTLVAFILTGHGWLPETKPGTDVSGSNSPDTPGGDEIIIQTPVHGYGVTPGIPATVPGTRDAPERLSRGMVPLDMLEILVNGVFAFAMTLIVKNNIPLPTSVPADELEFLGFYLVKILVDGFNFIFTFLILAVFYLLFFEIMRHTKLVDRTVASLSFGFILSILFIPLTSLLWTLSDKPIPYGVLFHANVLLSGVLLLILWWQISNNPLRSLPGTGRVDERNLCLRLLVFPLVSVVGLILDGWDVSFQTAPLALLYLIPFVLFVWLARKMDGEDVHTGNTRV